MVGKGSKVKVRYSVVEGDGADAGLNKAFDLIFAKCLTFSDSRGGYKEDRSVGSSKKLPIDKVVEHSLSYLIRVS